jgi:hypothetical protein
MKPLDTSTKISLTKLRNKIDDAYKEFFGNADVLIDKGNKAAALRSRKASKKIEELFLQWRKFTRKKIG